MSTSEFWCEASPVGDLLVRANHICPERDALVFPNARRTYAQLLEGSMRVARGLLSLGIRAGEHVGLLSTNSSEFAEALFGIALLGCVAVPINARHKSRELGYIIGNADLAAVLTTADANEYVDFCKLLHEALPSLAANGDPTQLVLPEAPRLRSAVLLRGENRPGFVGRTEFDARAQQIDPADVDEARLRVRVRDVAAIIYTSGTTAHPKGCMLSHEALTRGPVERGRRRLKSSNDHDVHWGAGPLFHIGSLAPFIGAIGSASTYVTDTYFDAGRAVEQIARERVTVAWPWFPAIVQAVIDHPAFDVAKMDALRSVILIGPSALVERVQALFTHAEVLQGCGMSETAGIFALSSPDASPLERANTQGKPVPGIEVRIVNFDTGEDARPGEVGEIWVRGYCAMEGYYRDPEKTASALDPDRWLHTGDLYLRTPDGNLVFHGRLKDMLKVGGENVAAIEVEAFLCGHPAVKLAEVVGRPDERLDEVPVAFVELRAGMKIEADELIAFCQGKIAKYKVPRAVYFVQADEWPMSATKVDKRALRARLAECCSTNVTL